LPGPGNGLPARHCVKAVILKIGAFLYAAQCAARNAPADDDHRARFRKNCARMLRRRQFVKPFNIGYAQDIDARVFGEAAYVGFGQHGIFLPCPRERTRSGEPRL